MKNILLNLIKYTFFFGLGGLLVWLALRNLTPQQQQGIINSFKTANYGWVLALVVLGLISNVSRAMRWNMLLKPMGYAPSLFNTFCAVMVGYMVNFGIPRGGEIARCGVLNRYEKIPLQRLIGTVITERIIDVLLLFVVFFLTLVLQFDMVSGFVNNNVFAPVQHKLAGIFSNGISIVIGVIVLSSILFIAWRLRGYVEKLKVYHHFLTFLKGLLEGLQAIRNLESPVAFILHSVFIWGMYLGGVYFGFLCLHETASLGLGASMSVLAIGSISMMVTPGGFGAYPVFVAKIMLLFGVAEEVGQASGWINWSGQFVSILLVGLIALIVLPIVNKDKKDGPTAVDSI